MSHLSKDALLRPLRESLWFIPATMVAGSLVLAWGLITFDAYAAERRTDHLSLFFGMGADGSRSMLTTIGGSMLSVAALTFTLTLSTLSQVSNQYSPRILRNFMRDRLNQFVMGYFVGVFAYCLITLGSIRSTDEGRFVPFWAVLTSLLLALGGIAALIVFIHHIAESLQTGTIVRHLFTDAIQAIDRLYPSQLGDPAPASSSAQAKTAQQWLTESANWQPVYTSEAGYLQHVDTEGLLQWATEHGLIVRLELIVGAFATEHTHLFSIRPDSTGSAPDQARQPADLLEHAVLGKHRNVEQDMAFGIQQLVDIALKALSPGINDTTTAIMAIDYLGALGVRLAQRDFPTQLRADEQQQIRVIARAHSFDDYMRLAFDLPRINATGDHAVFRRLLRALAQIMANVNSANRLPILQEQVNLLLQQADRTLETDYEKNEVRTLYTELGLRDR